MPRFEPNSSKKARRLGSTCAIFCMKISRFCRTSGRSCSLARSVFFSPEAQPLQGAPHRGTADVYLAASLQLLGDLVQRSIALLLEKGAYLLHARVVELGCRAATVRTRC